MSATSTYTSKSKIKFGSNKDFVFTFDVAGKVHRDFNLKFKVSKGTIVNEFSINNNFTSYTLKSGISPNFSAVKKKISDTTVTINFFDDELIIYEGEVYKQFDGESQSEIKRFYRKDEKLYVKTDLYSFSDEYIIRKNPQIKEGEYLRPVMVKKTFKNGSQETNQTEHFDTLDNPVNSNENKTYRIIVSDDACLISFLIKEGEAFKTIKNFTYPTTQVISEGTITLEIDNDMELSNLYFSFFKA